MPFQFRFQVATIDFRCIGAKTDQPRGARAFSHRDGLWAGVVDLDSVGCFDSRRAGDQCTTFTESTPPNSENGGLANAIVGSLILVLSATAVGTPIGILAGIYLAEYGQRTGLGRVTRFINDILLSAPSIVIGLFVYTIVVAQTRTFSGYAGVIALALIVIPVVVRTTENMRS